MRVEIHYDDATEASKARGLRDGILHCDELSFSHAFVEFLTNNVTVTTHGASGAAIEPCCTRHGKK